MTKDPFDFQTMRQIQHKIALLLAGERKPPEVAVTALLDLACSLACSARRLDQSRLDFKDTFIKAINTTLDGYLDDPALQQMAEEYNEAYLKFKLRNRVQQPNRGQDL